MGLFGAAPVGPVLGRWRALREDLGFPTILHSRQIHGNEILLHQSMPPGFHLARDADGHITAAAGLLLTVSVADCVPIFILDGETRNVALLHAGWRGAAAGILESGLAMMTGSGRGPADLHVHLGPAICGECYEVGPEVHAALGLRTPEQPAPVDLRAVLARRAVGQGVRPDRVSRSSFCTRCDATSFFSHRNGSVGRQIAFIGIRPGRS
jgi:YfiH family protein